MAGNNLQILGTGLDHRYLNGLPIVEAEIIMADIFKRVARISSLAVQADPYFDGKTGAQKMFSESHGEGDRITTDFLEEGAREILPIFHPLQQWIPEGTYDSTPLTYEFSSQAGDFSWNNPDPSSIFVNNIEVRCTGGNGDITFVVDGNSLGTVTLPDFQIDQASFLAYDLAGFLGGAGVEYFKYGHAENVRNNNIAQVIELLVSENTSDFVFDIKINAIKYDAIGWFKALTQAGDVSLPSYADNIHINHLIKDFCWENGNQVKVTGVTLKWNAGSANVTIKRNGVDGDVRFLDRLTIGEDYYGLDDTNTISIVLDEATSDFNYDLIINTELPKIIPSPRFEFDSNWNPGKIVFRYQNMDSRSECDKLNYTSETLKHIRVDTNVFDNVLNFLNDALKNYVLKELYLAIGYDKKAIHYAREYEKSRDLAKFWVRSEKGLQTQYHYAGV